MNILPSREHPPGRSGLLRGVTIQSVQDALDGLSPDQRRSDPKVSCQWRFSADGKLCGIWDYRRSYELRGEFSTFGPDEILRALFGDAYISEAPPEKTRVTIEMPQEAAEKMLLIQEAAANGDSQAKAFCAEWNLESITRTS